ncbi:MAG: hypothetical protein AAB849_02355 [Patescibacteria group bacterium]
MFRRWFIWCLALVVLGGATITCADYGAEKNQSKVKIQSEIIAAKYDYAVVEDVTPSKRQISDLEIVSFLNDDESYINGTVMRVRAVILKANLGLVDAKRLLDNQEEIPVEFRSKVLVFTGTLLRDSGGRLHVACLYWGGGRWCLRFDWIDGGFFGACRLLRGK